MAGDTTTPDLTKEVVASWHNGSSAMIGKSYDGTLSNGVAATGVEGLKTIVPVSAISDWYLYSRTGGVRHNTNYPGGSLNPTVTTEGNPDNPPGVNLPRRLQQGNPPTGPCADENAVLNNDANSDGGDGDAHGDYNKFWNDRDHVKDASKVKAAVFATHGFQDDNVKMDQLGAWWEALKANNVPRKLWLLRAGHEDPFESQRARVGHHPAPLVRPLALRREQRHRERAEGPHRGQDGHVGRLRRVARPRDAERGPLPARGGQPRRGRARWRA